MPEQYKPRKRLPSDGALEVTFQDRPRIPRVRRTRGQVTNHEANALTQRLLVHVSPPHTARIVDAPPDSAVPLPDGTIFVHLTLSTDSLPVTPTALKPELIDSSRGTALSTEEAEERPNSPIRVTLPDGTKTGISELSLDQAKMVISAIAQTHGREAVQAIINEMQQKKLRKIGPQMIKPLFRRGDQAIVIERTGILKSNISRFLNGQALLKVDEVKMILDCFQLTEQQYTEIMSAYEDEYYSVHPRPKPRRGDSTP